MQNTTNINKVMFPYLDLILQSYFCSDVIFLFFLTQLWARNVILEENKK